MLDDVGSIEDDGLEVGRSDSDGFLDGLLLGAPLVECWEGCLLGSPDEEGCFVGPKDGFVVGCLVGLLVTAIAEGFKLLGISVALSSAGSTFGISSIVGDALGVLGLVVGCRVGLVVGFEVGVAVTGVNDQMVASVVEQSSTINQVLGS